MNILFISALGMKEKGAQSIRMTLEGYARAGHNVFLVTTKKPHSRDYFYESEYKPKTKNLKIIRIWLPLGKLATKSGKINRLRELYLFTVVSFFKGLILIKKEKIDLLYGYEVRGIFSAYYLSKLFKKPLVTRFQGTILDPIIKNRDKDKKSWRRVWDHRFAMKLRPDLYIMANDGTLGDKVLSYFKAPKEQVRFWMNGINKNICNIKDSKYLKNKYSLPEDSTVLLTVHRLAAWKKTERALFALSEVVKSYPKTYLFIIGDGERKRALEKICKDLDIYRNVFFVGGVPNKEIGKYLNNADVYLGTYDLSNAGNPLFESMICGLAIISIDNGSTKDFLDGGKAGILIKDGKEFSKEIERLIKNPGLLSRYKEKAKLYSRENFWTWDERIQEEIREIEKLCK